MDLDTALTGKSAEPAAATRMLRDDHAEMRHLIDDYRKAEGRSAHARHALLEALAMQAELHTRVEEDVFYPAVERLCMRYVHEARDAHAAIAAKVDALEALDADDARHGEIAAGLIDALERHMDEEERLLFPRVEAEMAGELTELGRRIIERKEALTRSVEDMEGPAT